jgi:hypothetical protein
MNGDRAMVFYVREDLLVILSYGVRHGYVYPNPECFGVLEAAIMKRPAF